MNNLSKKEKTFMLLRFLILILVIALMVYITMKCIPVMSKLSDENYRIEFKNEISNMGFKGVLTVLGLQILQIIVAVIPGQPMEIIAGMLYGTWGGMLLCLLGIFIGTLIVFFIVRKVGTDFMQLFFKKEQIDEIKNSKIFRNPAKFEILMFIMFVLPFLPKDIFIYLGGISPVRPKRFLAIATLARIPGLFVTVYAGNKLSEGSFLVTVMLVLVFLIVGIIGYKWGTFKQKEMEKEEEILEEKNEIEKEA